MSAGVPRRPVGLALWALPRWMSWLVVACAVAAEATRYFDLVLDPESRFRLYWTVDYEAELLTAELKLDLPSEDWFAIGFSDRGDVSLADVCVLWADPHGRPHLEDGWTDDAGYVAVDEQNDCVLGSLKRKGSTLRFLFTRKFDTCDSHDYVIEDGTVHLVYATGKGPLRRLEGLRLTRAQHGFQRAQLLKVMEEPPPFPSDTKFANFLNDKVKVPGQETTYWCRLLKLPSDFGYKKHIVKYEANIQKGNEALVHHMELFHCEAPVDEILPPWNGPCNSPDRPEPLDRCKRVIAAWAMGAPPLAYPEEAGLSTGGSDYSPYVMLEVHYNNPAQRNDYVDSSGITIYYTGELRPFDVGILEIGLEYTDKMAIPPQKQGFHLTGYCISECTRVALPNSGITLVAAQLHTHLTGERVWVRHVRGGAELPEMARDDHFSTHFQEIRLLKRRLQLMPGDALVITCSYNTVDRANVTLGGFGIREEMCVSYIHYFPKTDLEVCKSSIETSFLQAYFKYMNLYHDAPTSDQKGISDNYKSIPWNRHNVLLLDRLYQTMPLSMQCNKSSGDRFPGSWEGMPVTEILYPLPPPARNCPEGEGLPQPGHE
ncbi:dopamine beta-hydroxylase-like [Dermacentor andersoni]|uniref:dopamine beta-hydroxylase-like n=1 Tax=Dermacentor andersoni TaxID=34620 RepID=UPI002155A7A0|nr:dopamine beta-hydroxylase-like [Dermacentor andersoni]